MEEKIFVNSDENLCQVTLICDEGTFVGKATCSSEDKFDVNRGLELARKRALVQVKNADLKIFNEKLRELEDRKNEIMEFVRQYKRAKDRQEKAKKCLTELYREIGELTK